MEVRDDIRAASITASIRPRRPTRRGGSISLIITVRSYPDSNHHDKDKVDDHHSDVSSIHTDTCSGGGWTGEA
ncbi:hypothetical protein EYF80_021450 [Liparis tanakae]|uniref:Uncharacterized protein n=1 Tax=Liparis tanakae TaxID=230148 RepID=A0A4Z2HR03_9TELE|nr:hypothetical protein EYF80_021450 [Liparis tanakae]